MPNCRKEVCVTANIQDTHEAGALKCTGRYIQKHISSCTRNEMKQAYTWFVTEHLVLSHA